METQFPGTKPINNLMNQPVSKRSRYDGKVKMDEKLLFTISNHQDKTGFTLYSCRNPGYILKPLIGIYRAVFLALGYIPRS